MNEPQDQAQPEASTTAESPIVEQPEAESWPIRRSWEVRAHLHLSPDTGKAFALPTNDELDLTIREALEAKYGVSAGIDAYFTVSVEIV